MPSLKEQFSKKPISFSERVIRVVRNIPKGRVMSYGEVAKLAGSPGAARAVGTIMKHNKNKNVPCHRVVRSDGSIGEYNGINGEKERLLKEEGVILSRK